MISPTVQVKCIVTQLSCTIAQLAKFNPPISCLDLSTGTHENGWTHQRNYIYRERGLRSMRTGEQCVQERTENASQHATCPDIVAPKVITRCMNVNKIPGPPPKESIVEHQKEIGLWGVVFPSSLDKIAVERMVSCLTENPEGIPGVNESAHQIKKREAFWSTVKPVHFGMNMASKSVLGVLRFITLALLVWVFSRFSTGRWLLMKFPAVFSLGLFRKNGPTEEEVANASFKLWFVGRGYSDAALASKEGKKPDMEIITRVTGPEIGYSATPIILIQCALVLLSQRHELPKGGVFLPGIIFGPTDLQQRLQQNGISFEFISKKMLSNKI